MAANNAKGAKIKKLFVKHSVTSLRSLRFSRLMFCSDSCIAKFIFITQGGLVSRLRPHLPKKQVFFAAFAALRLKTGADHSFCNDI